MAMAFIGRTLVTKPTSVPSSILSRSFAVKSFSSFSSPLSHLRPLAALTAFHRVSSVPTTPSLRCFSSRPTTSSLNDQSPNWNNRPPKETILLEGCDFEHWLIVVEKPEGDPTRDEIIDSYIKIAASIVGSEEEARKQIYSVSTRHYFAFGIIVPEEVSYKFKELPNVRWVLPDSYLDVRNKDYGGEPFINGQAVPYDPKYHEEWVRNNARANERSRRNDRPRNFDRSRNFERRRENMQNRDYQGPPGGPGGPGPNMGGAAPPPNVQQGPPGGPGGPGPHMGGAAPPPNVQHAGYPTNIPSRDAGPNAGYPGNVPVKFCVDRDDEEEEEEQQQQRREEVLRNRARMRKKQKRVVDDDSDGRAGNLDGDDDDYSSVNAAEQEESGLSVILTDPEVLDCSICMEPLSSPVFQCENGHIACSQCCTKLLNKCPSCSWPIGYSRCLAIEKVIDAIKVSCRYKLYGCRETFSYTHKHTHEETCICTPCPCPISSCDFRGSSKQLSLHFSSKHRSSGRRFGYNCPFTVSFGKLESYLVFQEFNDGPIFVLSNQVELIGSAIRVACLDPHSSNGGFLYDLVAKKDGSALRLQSRTKCVKEQSEASSSADFLLVPYEFFCSSGKLKLEICIRNVGEVESVAHEMFSS